MESLFNVTDDQVAKTTDDWYTPRWLFTAAAIMFDLDVAAPVDPAVRTCPARSYLTAADDGLTQQWYGTVWMNPPYSKPGPWVTKWASHPAGLALLPAFHHVPWIGQLMGSADAITLLSVVFRRPDGTGNRPWSSLILAARGAECVAGLARVAAADDYAGGAYHVKP